MNKRHLIISYLFFLMIMPSISHANTFGKAMQWLCGFHNISFSYELESKITENSKTAEQTQRGFIYFNFSDNSLFFTEYMSDKEDNPKQAISIEFNNGIEKKFQANEHKSKNMFENNGSLTISREKFSNIYIPMILSIWINPINFNRLHIDTIKRSTSTSIANADGLTIIDNNANVSISYKKGEHLPNEINIFDGDGTNKYPMYNIKIFKYEQIDNFYFPTNVTIDFQYGIPPTLLITQNVTIPKDSIKINSDISPKITARTGTIVTDKTKGSEEVYIMSDINESSKRESEIVKILEHYIKTADEK